MESDSYDVHSKSADKVRPANQGFQRTIWSLYILTVTALFAAAVIVAVTLHDGAFYWPLMILGAVIVSVLLSAAAVPHLRDRVAPRVRPRRVSVPRGRHSPVGVSARR